MLTEERALAPGAGLCDPADAHWSSQPVSPTRREASSQADAPLLLRPH